MKFSLDPSGSSMRRSGMLIRELPSVDWYRLIGHPALQGATLPDARHARCVVAEDAEGRIRALWWALTVVQLEGGWVDPALKGLSRGRIVRRVASTLLSLLDSCGVRGVCCYAPTHAIGSLLQHLGFTPQPWVPFTLSNPCLLPPLSLQASSAPPEP